MNAPAYTAQQNMQARSLILANAREMQQITNTNSNISMGVQQNIPLRNIGLNKRIILEVTGTVAATAAETQNLTPWGLANVLSQVIVTDLANYNRIQTFGPHLYALASLRRQLAYGAAYVQDAPVSMGSNLQVNNATPTINAGTGSKTFRVFYELPLAYSDTDLRGAIYAAVVNATWQVSYTLNPSFFCAHAADPTNSVYQSSTAQLGTLSAVQVIVQQIFLDQLPFGQNGQPILPYFDLATGYLIQNTGFSVAPAVNIDYPIQYPNFRSILSAFLQIDNGGLSTGGIAGTDLNKIGIQAANLVYLVYVDAFTWGLRIRNSIGDDLPAGSYILETRISPINTTAYGNMQIVLNFATVNAPWSLNLGWEMFAVINSVAGASSLPAN